MLTHLFPGAAGNDPGLFPLLHERDDLSGQKRLQGPTEDAMLLLIVNQFHGVGRLFCEIFQAFSSGRKAWMLMVATTSVPRRTVPAKTA